MPQRRCSSCAVALNSVSWISSAGALSLRMYSSSGDGAGVVQQHRDAAGAEARELQVEVLDAAVRQQRQPGTTADALGLQVRRHLLDPRIQLGIAVVAARRQFTHGLLARPVGGGWAIQS